MTEKLPTHKTKLHPLLAVLPSCRLVDFLFNLRKCTKYELHPVNGQFNYTEITQIHLISLAF